MIRLYEHPVSSSSFKCKAVAYDLALPIELVTVDVLKAEHRSPEFLRKNPNGRIPVLVSGELVTFEAAAICMYLADGYPGARLAPPPGTAERAQYYQWLTYLSNTLQPAYMAFRYPEQYTTEPGQHAGIRRAAAARAEAAFAVLERALERGPFLLGAQYSVCDAYLYMLGWWGEKWPEPPSRLPNWRRCLQQVAQRPATRLACETEGIELRFVS